MANYFNAAVHDFSLVDPVSGDIIGFVLSRDKGLPSWMEFDSQYLADQFFTGTPSVANMNPQEEIPMILSDFRAGYGQEFYEASDPKRYYYSIGADLRFKGQGILSWGSTGITIPTYPGKVTDPGLEVWTDANTLTNWTYAAAASHTLTRGTSSPHSGTYFAQIDDSAGGSDYSTLKQNVTWNNNYRGKTITLKAYGRTQTGGSGNWKIGIYDGVGTTDSSTDNTATYSQLSVSRVIDAAATELQIILYANPTNGEFVRLDTISHDIPYANGIKTHKTFNNAEYLAGGNILWQLDGTGDGLTYVRSFATAEAGDPTNLITWMESFQVSAVDYLFICLGTSSPYWYMHGGTSVETCDGGWSELVDGDVTSTADTSDFKEGLASAKLVVAAGAAANDILATTAITSTDITSYDHVTFWIKSSVALAADDLRFLVDETASCASPDLTLAVPAMAADTWARVSLPLGATTGLNAVISLGIEMQVDKGAFTVRIDDIRFSTFTESNATNKTYQFMQWVHTTVDTMYANDGGNTTRSTVNPLNGGTAWSTQTVWGDAANTITQLYSKSGALYTGKKDTMYYLDSSGNVQDDYAPELVSATSAHTCKNADFWQGEFFIPAGDQALLRVGTANEFINPSKYITNSTDFSGQVEAVTHDEEWLYVGTDNSTKAEIIAGRSEDVDGTTAWRWHPYHELTITGIETMWVSTVYKKRLWIASTSSSDQIFYLPLPTKYGNLTADGERNFKTGGYFVSPAQHGGFKSDTKAYIKATASLGHAYDADIYWECHYKKLIDTSYTDAGDFKGSATDRVATLYLPVDASSKNPITTMMWFKLVGVTDDTTKTPILLDFDVRGILYPARKDIIACKVRVAKEMVGRSGGPKISDKFKLMKDCLSNARKTATWPVTMVDIEGTTRYVKLLPLPSNIPFRNPTAWEKGKSIEWEYNLLLETVALS